MKNVKALLSLKIVNFKKCRQGLLNKNIAVLLIVFCVGVNGFVPKNVNINKNSLVLVLALTTHNAVIDIFKRCNDSLIIISSKISKDLGNFLFQTSTNSSDISAQKKSQNNPNKDSTTNSSVVIINGTSNNNKVKKIFFDNYFILDYAFISFVKLFKLYMDYKVSPEECVSRGVIFLMFIVFIFAIRQRKIIKKVDNLFNEKFLLENKNLGIQVTNVSRFLCFIKRVNGINK
ncbi:MAG: hypothetical protein LBU10_00775 [Endomicrobium sp.]|jgi:hypothetical protein|nr:hypothetical protein [Endomicrobium sp.]